MTLNQQYAQLMPKNIFIDLNVIVDVLLAREGFELSRDVIKLGEQGNYQLFISAHMVTTLAYLLEEAKVQRTTVLKHVAWLLNTFTVVPTDAQLLWSATNSRITDFEDAVIEQAAAKANASVVITRNIRDFRDSIVLSQTPKQYLLDLPWNSLTPGPNLIG